LLPKGKSERAGAAPAIFIFIFLLAPSARARKGLFAAHGCWFHFHLF
jgi:hypothetical protein